MKVLDQYFVSFHGSKEGIHEFDFDVNPEFFEYFENPDFAGGKLKIKVILDRKPQILTLDFSITGYMQVFCDRCLEIFNYPVAIKEILFIKYGDHFEELDNNVIVIPREDKRINIAQYIYEFVILNMPVKKIHPDNTDGPSTCNPDMLQKLKDLSKNKKVNTDPRWDNLRKII